MNVISAGQIELRAIRILDRLAKGEFREDALVELKRELNDPYKIARRIAGHCNASRNETILWIIGADEKSGIVGWSAPDFAEYLPKVWAYFSEERPTCTEVSFHYSSLPCTALAFSSVRTPYLVSNPSFGLEKGVVIEREIPWRDGTRIRTATRDEVMRLLLDHSLTPHVEFMSGQISEAPFPHKFGPPVDGQILVEIHLEFYAMPRDSRPVVIPRHRIAARLSDRSDEFTSEDFRSITFWSEEGRRVAAKDRGRLHHTTGNGPIFPPLPPPPPHQDSVTDTGTEVILSRAAHVHLQAQAFFDERTWKEWDKFKVEFVLYVGIDQIPLLITSDLLSKETLDD